SDGFFVNRVSLALEHLYTADEIFLTGTAAEVTPVREVDRRTIGSGKPGELTRWVQQEYAAAVRGERQQWAHFCQRVDRRQSKAASA
ncbi:MAG: hypothetical protein AAFQ82_10910, partial [Myxococcota bacterium]